MPGPGEQIATTAIDALRSTPMAIALLLLNACFLAFAMYLLGQVATNSGERNKSQTELISKLVSECHKVP